MDVLQAMKSHPYITASAAGLVLLALVSRGGGGGSDSALIEAGLASKSIDADVTKAALGAQVQFGALQVQGMSVNAELQAQRNLAAKEMYLGAVQAKTALDLGQTNAMIAGFMDLLRSGDTRAGLAAAERVQLAQTSAAREVALGEQSTRVGMLAQQLTFESAMADKILTGQSANLNSLIQHDEAMRRLGYDNSMGLAYIDKEVQLAAIKAGKSATTKQVRADERANYLDFAATIADLFS